MSLPKQAEIKSAVLQYLSDTKKNEIDKHDLLAALKQQFSLGPQELEMVFEKSGKPIVETRLKKVIGSLSNDGVLSAKSGTGTYAVRCDNPEPPAPSGKRKLQKSKIVLWISDNQSKGISLAGFLIFCYMLPIFLVCFAAWQTEGFLEPHYLLGWLSSFLNSSETYLSDFHKILFPIISAISVVSLKNKPSTAVLLFSGIVFLGYLLSVGMHVYLNTADVKNALGGLPDPLNTDLILNFFSRVKETLLMYFMMLIGINVSNSMTGGKNE